MTYKFHGVFKLPVAMTTLLSTKQLIGSKRMEQVRLDEFTTSNWKILIYHLAKGSQLNVYFVNIVLLICWLTSISSIPSEFYYLLPSSVLLTAGDMVWWDGMELARRHCWECCQSNSACYQPFYYCQFITGESWGFLSTSTSCMLSRR